VSNDRQAPGLVESFSRITGQVHHLPKVIAHRQAGCPLVSLRRAGGLGSVMHPGSAEAVQRGERAI